MKFGPVTLADAIESAPYDVVKLRQLAMPVGVDGDATNDPDRHLVAYTVAREKTAPKFAPRSNVAVHNECGATFVQLKKPTTLLLPTAAAAIAVAAPDPDVGVDHFLCYGAKGQKVLTSGLPVPVLAKHAQVDVNEDGATKRYDLKKIAALCLPADKSGAPVLLAGPQKGAPKPIVPAAIHDPATALLCYTVRLAKKVIAQDGCAPVDPADKGTKIVPPQAPPPALVGWHTANQFGATRVDRKKPQMLCMPSQVGG